MSTAVRGTPRLIVVAHALAPGAGGPESQVNLEFLRALAAHWKAGVSVISGGSSPALRDGTPLAALPGWRVHALGECGAAAGGAHRFAEIGVRQLRRGGPGALAARVAEKLIHLRTGQGIKMASWQGAAAKILARELESDPQAVVYSRALPFASVAAVDAVRRSRPLCWLVNVNDPMPAGVWPGLYPVDPRTELRTRERFEAAIPRIGGITFPSAALRDLELAAFPALARVPSEVLPHIAAPTGNSRKGGLPAGRLRIAFSGTLRKNRTRSELVDALARLRQRAPAVCDELELCFHLARDTPFAERYISSLPVRTLVFHEEDEATLARALAEAEVLLDLECEADRPLLLTKVVHYLAAGRPLWAFCAPGGTTWELVHTEAWGYASRLGDPEGAAEDLRRIHSDWARGELASRAPSLALQERFSPRRQVEDLLGLLERTL
jgi:hypothetical protein